MELAQQKEQFSTAYVHAVASVAGYSVYPPSVDDDSVDRVIAESGGNGTIRSPRLEVQLKCTSNNVGYDDYINYPLKIKNYEDLRPTNLLVPRLLVVVFVPEDVEYWLEQSEDRLSMKRCGYWLSLRGEEDTENSASVTVNSASVTVKLPRYQKFTVDSLKAIMEQIANGETP